MTTWDVFAMDTWFRHSLGSYPFDVRCEILSEIGYDATYLSLFNIADWSDVEKFKTIENYGLDLAGLYYTINLDSNDEEFKDFLELISDMRICDNIEIAITSDDSSLSSSDPMGDQLALERLQLILDATNNETISLYPHVGHWMERVEDGVRLCESLNHSRVGVVFPSYHWYAIDGDNILSLLDKGASYLTSVNLCGTRKPAPASEPRSATIEPMGRGELDNFIILGQLDRIGYNERIGIQGYSIGGDVYSKLDKSLLEFRDMERRINEHPSWAHIQLD